MGWLGTGSVCGVVRMRGRSRRGFIRGVLVACGVGSSGCLGTPKVRSIGQSVNVDGVSIAVSRVVVSDTIHVGNTGFSPMLGRVFVAPVIRIQNATDTAIALPGPDADISVRYRYFDANYGPFYRVRQEMRVGAEMFPTYAGAYGALDERLGPYESVWGIGPPHELPEQFDRSETAVRIRGGFGEFEWGLE